MKTAQEFIAYAQKYVPKFKVAFKNQSWFMKFLSWLLFFNKDFYTQYITTIGYTVYVPTEAEYLANQEKYLGILAHEFVHMMDYKKYGMLFSLSYMLPQMLAVFSLLSFLAIHFSMLWLLCIGFLIFAAPFPAYFRMYWELRGYTMSAAFDYWKYKVLPNTTEYVDVFFGSGYFFMWPFKKNMTNQLQKMFNAITDNSILIDEPYGIVNDFLTQ